MQALSSLCHLPCQECWDPSDLSDLDNMEEAIDNELQSLSNPQSGDGDGNQGDGGPCNIYCGLSLLGANVVMVDGQSHHCQGYH